MSKELKDFKKDVEILDKNIKELNEKLDNIIKNKEKREKFPKHGERFCYIAHDGSITLDNWDNENVYYKESWRLGNGFYTLEEADEARKKMRSGDSLNI